MAYVSTLAFLKQNKERHPLNPCASWRQGVETFNKSSLEAHTSALRDASRYLRSGSASRFSHFRAVLLSLPMHRWRLKGPIVAIDVFAVDSIGISR